MMGLTAKQSRCLAIIRESIATTGRAPTFQEIVVAMGGKSRGNAQRLLNALEERGIIRRLHGKARAIEIVADELTFLAPDLQRAVRAYAASHHIKPETAVAEAVRAYCGVAA